MVLYGITIVPLIEELGAVDPGRLSPFYAHDAAFGSLERRSAQLLKLLMERGTDRGYLPEPAKSLLISETLLQEEAAKREFAVEGLTLNFLSGSWYLGAYLGLQKELEVWVKPQVEAWTRGVIVLGKIDQRHPPSAYSVLRMLLQLKWQYLQRAVPGVGTLIGPIEVALKEKNFKALFGGEDINATFRKSLGHSVKRGGLGITDPRLSAESAYNIYKVANGELVDSLLGGSTFN